MIKAYMAKKLGISWFLRELNITMIDEQKWSKFRSYRTRTKHLKVNIPKQKKKHVIGLKNYSTLSELRWKKKGLNWKKNVNYLTKTMNWLTTWLQINKKCVRHRKKNIILPSNIQ